MSKYQRLCIEHGWFTRGDNEQFKYVISIAEDLENLLSLGKRGIHASRQFHLLCHMTYVFSLGDVSMSSIADIITEEYKI